MESDEPGYSPKDTYDVLVSIRSHLEYAHREEVERITREANEKERSAREAIIAANGAGFEEPILRIVIKLIGALALTAALLLAGIIPNELGIKSAVYEWGVGTTGYTWVIIVLTFLGLLCL